MTDLRAIDGGKKARAKKYASGRILRCPPPCGSDEIDERWKGRVVDSAGRVIFKGTLIIRCAECKKLIE